jgi:hypothetical protein
MMTTLAPIDREASPFPTNSGSGEFSADVDQLLIDIIFDLLMAMEFPHGSGTSGGASGTPSGGAAGGSGPSTSTVPTVSSNNAAQAVASDLEQRYGLTPTQAAGVLGNMQQESSMECNVNQGGRRGAPNGDCSGGAGYGLAQWDGSRKQGEIDYAREHHLDPGSLQANIGFMNQELDGPYSKTIRDIKQTSTADQAARVWEQDYEQAGIPDMGNRDQYADAFLKQGL